MFVNALPTEQAALAAAIDPASVAPGTVESAWVDMAQYESLLAVLNTGVLGASATVDAKIEQATSAAGAGAKDVPNKAITQIVKATGDDKQAAINLRSEHLDANNKYQFVRLSVTVAAAASLLGAQLYGFHPRVGPAHKGNPASVVEIVQ